MTPAFVLVAGSLPFWVWLTGTYPLFSLFYLLAVSLLAAWLLFRDHSPTTVPLSHWVLGAWLVYQTFHSDVWHHSTQVLQTLYLSFLLYLISRRVSWRDPTVCLKMALSIWCLASGISALNPGWQAHDETLEEALRLSGMEESYREAILHAALQQRFLFPFGNPIHLGLFLTLSLLAFPYLYSETYRQPRPWLWRLALFVTGTVQLYVLWGTRARTSLLAFLAGVAISIGLWKRLNRRAMALGTLLAITLVAAFLLTPGGREMLSRVETIRARTIYWGIALNMIHDHPLLGLGLGGFGDHFTQYRPLTPHQTQYPHQLFLDVMTDTGAVGLFLFLSVLGEGLIRFLREAGSSLREGGPDPVRFLTIWRSSVLAAFLLSAQVGFPHHAVYLLGLLAVILGLRHTPFRRPSHSPDVRVFSGSVWRMLLLVCFLVPFGVREYGGAVFEQARQDLETRRNPARSAERIDRARSIWPPLWEAHYFSARLRWDRGDLKSALRTMNRAIDWNPLTAFLREDRAKLLWRMNEREKAIDAIRDAIRLHPVKWQYHETLGRWLHVLGRDQEAFTEKRLARKLRSIEPDYGKEIEKIRSQRRKR